MTEQQQQREDVSCAVDLSASSLPESTPSEEVFTTTIDTAEPESGVAGFGFSEALLTTLAEKGYTEPSPIQKAAFPELMLGRDLVGQAQTGTGKTAAFALPLTAASRVIPWGSSASRPQAYPKLVGRRVLQVIA